MQNGTDSVPRSTARNGTIALADQAVVSGTNFLTGVVIGRTCTKEQFGLYMLGFSLWLLVMSVQTSLIVTPYAVYSPRLTSDDRARYSGSTLIHQFGLSALAALALAVGGGFLACGIGPRGLAPVVWALASTISLILLREYIRQTSFASLRFSTALVLDVGVALGQLGGLLLLAHFALLTASTTYVVIGSASGLAAAGWLALRHRTLQLNAAAVRKDFAQNWRLGKWAFASGALWMISMEVYPWILTAFHGSASAGVWGACFGVAAIGNPLMLGMMSIFGPTMAYSFADGGVNSLRRTLAKACGVSLIVMAPFCGLLLTFGDSLVATLYGPKYAGNGPVVSALALNLLASTVTLSISRALFITERADLDFATTFVPLCVLLTVGLGLVHSYGPMGVACALLAGNTASLLARLWVFSRLARPLSVRQEGFANLP